VVVSSPVTPPLLDREDAQGEGGPQAADAQRELERAAEPDRAKRGKDERDDHRLPDLHANQSAKPDPILTRARGMLPEGADEGCQRGDHVCR
jgi:hypothetical protein